VHSDGVYVIDHNADDVLHGARHHALRLSDIHTFIHILYCIIQLSKNMSTACPLFLYMLPFTP
jgi:hypothetical protein